MNAWLETGFKCSARIGLSMERSLAIFNVQVFLLTQISFDCILGDAKDGCNSLNAGSLLVELIDLFYLVHSDWIIGHGFFAVCP
jgi:hypothetical protein